MKYSRILKTISLVLIHAFLFEQLAFAAPELKPLHFNLFEKPTVDLGIPESVATIEDVFVGAPRWAARPRRAPQRGAPTIYLIQDAHANYSGQVNLQKTLKHLFEKDKDLKTVFIEAGLKDSSLSFLRRFGTQEQRERAADPFLRRGELNGEEYLSLVSGRDFAIWGVEDLVLYQKALRDYQYVVKERPRFETYLSTIEISLKALKSRLLNPHLLSFHNVHEKYLSGDLPVTDYFDILGKKALLCEISLNAYPELKALKSLREKESNIDFKKADEELKREDAASHAPSKLKAEEKAGDLGFFADLEERLKGREKEYPELFKYFDYLHASKALKADKVLDELKALEREVTRALTETRDEETYLRCHQSLFLLKKLFSFTLTPEDYADYKKESLSFEDLTGFLNRKILDMKELYERTVFLEEGQKEIIQHAEAFYDLTYRRDIHFVKETLRKMGETGETKAVLITGGFHSPNLKSLLRRENVSFVNITPQVTHETNLRRYESLLLGQKTILANPALSFKTTSSTARPFAELPKALFLNDPTVLNRLLGSLPGAGEMTLAGARLAAGEPSKNDEEIGRLLYELQVADREWAQSVAKQDYNQMAGVTLKITAISEKLLKAGLSLEQVVNLTTGARAAKVDKAGAVKTQSWGLWDWLHFSVSSDEYRKIEQAIEPNATANSLPFLMERLEDEYDLTVLNTRYLGSRTLAHWLLRRTIAKRMSAATKNSSAGSRAANVFVSLGVGIGKGIYWIFNFFPLIQLRRARALVKGVSDSLQNGAGALQDQIAAVVKSESLIRSFRWWKKWWILGLGFHSQNKILEETESGIGALYHPINAAKPKAGSKTFMEQVSGLQVGHEVSLQVVTSSGGLKNITGYFNGASGSYMMLQIPSRSMIQFSKTPRYRKERVGLIGVLHIQKLAGRIEGYAERHVTYGAPSVEDREAAEALKKLQAMPRKLPPVRPAASRAAQDSGSAPSGEKLSNILDVAIWSFTGASILTLAIAFYLLFEPSQEKQKTPSAWRAPPSGRGSKIFTPNPVMERTQLNFKSFSELMDILKGDSPDVLKVDAAAILANRGYEQAFPATLAMYERLERQRNNLTAQIQSSTLTGRNRVLSLRGPMTELIRTEGFLKSLDQSLYKLRSIIALPRPAAARLAMSKSALIQEIKNRLKENTGGFRVDVKIDGSVPDDLNNIQKTDVVSKLSSLLKDAMFYEFETKFTRGSDISKKTIRGIITILSVPAASRAANDGLGPALDERLKKSGIHHLHNAPGGSHTVNFLNNWFLHIQVRKEEKDAFDAFLKSASTHTGVNTLYIDPAAWADHGWGLDEYFGKPAGDSWWNHVDWTVNGQTLELRPWEDSKPTKQRVLLYTETKHDATWWKLVLAGWRPVQWEYSTIKYHVPIFATGRYSLVITDNPQVIEEIRRQESRYPFILIGGSNEQARKLQVRRVQPDISYGELDSAMKDILASGARAAAKLGPPTKKADDRRGGSYNLTKISIDSPSDMNLLTVAFEGMRYKLDADFGWAQLPGELLNSSNTIRTAIERSTKDDEMWTLVALVWFLEANMLGFKDEAQRLFKNSKMTPRRFKQRVVALIQKNLKRREALRAEVLSELNSLPAKPAGARAAASPEVSQFPRPSLEKTRFYRKPSNEITREVVDIIMDGFVEFRRHHRHPGEDTSDAHSIKDSSDGLSRGFLESRNQEINADEAASMKEEHGEGYVAALKAGQEVREAFKAIVNRVVEREFLSNLNDDLKLEVLEAKRGILSDYDRGYLAGLYAQQGSLELYKDDIRAQYGNDYLAGYQGGESKSDEIFENLTAYFLNDDDPTDDLLEALSGAQITHSKYGMFLFQDLDAKIIPPWTGSVAGSRAAESANHSERALASIGPRSRPRLERRLRHSGFELLQKDASVGIGDKLAVIGRNGISYFRVESFDRDGKVEFVYPISRSEVYPLGGRWFHTVPELIKQGYYHKPATSASRQQNIGEPSTEKNPPSAARAAEADRDPSKRKSEFAATLRQSGMTMELLENERHHFQGLEDNIRGRVYSTHYNVPVKVSVPVGNSGAQTPDRAVISFQVGSDRPNLYLSARVGFYSPNVGTPEVFFEIDRNNSIDVWNLSPHVASSDFQALAADLVKSLKLAAGRERAPALYPLLIGVLDSLFKPLSILNSHPPAKEKMLQAVIRQHLNKPEIRSLAVPHTPLSEIEPGTVIYGASGMVALVLAKPDSDHFFICSLDSQEGFEFRTIPKSGLPAGRVLTLLALAKEAFAGARAATMPVRKAADPLDMTTPEHIDKLNFLARALEGSITFFISAEPVMVQWWRTRFIHLGYDVWEIVTDRSDETHQNFLGFLRKKFGSSESVRNRIVELTRQQYMPPAYQGFFVNDPKVGSGNVQIQNPNNQGVWLTLKFDRPFTQSPDQWFSRVRIQFSYHNTSVPWSWVSATDALAMVKNDYGNGSYNVWAHFGGKDLVMKRYKLRISVDDGETWDESPSWIHVQYEEPADGQDATPQGSRAAVVIKSAAARRPTIASPAQPKKLAEAELIKVLGKIAEVDRLLSELATVKDGDESLISLAPGNTEFRTRRDEIIDKLVGHGAGIIPRLLEVLNEKDTDPKIVSGATEALAKLTAGDKEVKKGARLADQGASEKIKLRGEINQLLTRPDLTGDIAKLMDIAADPDERSEIAIRFGKPEVRGEFIDGLITRALIQAFQDVRNPVLVRGAAVDSFAAGREEAEALTAFLNRSKRWGRLNKNSQDLLLAVLGALERHPTATATNILIEILGEPANKPSDLSQEYTFSIIYIATIKALKSLPADDLILEILIGFAKSEENVLYKRPAVKAAIEAIGERYFSSSSAALELNYLLQSTNDLDLQTSIIRALSNFIKIDIASNTLLSFLERADAYTDASLLRETIVALNRHETLAAILGLASNLTDKPHRDFRVRGMVVSALVEKRLVEDSAEDRIRDGAVVQAISDKNKEIRVAAVKALDQLRISPKIIVRLREFVREPINYGVLVSDELLPEILKAISKDSSAPKIPASQNDAKSADVQHGARAADSHFRVAPIRFLPAAEAMERPINETDIHGFATGLRAAGARLTTPKQLSLRNAEGRNAIFNLTETSIGWAFRSDELSTTVVFTPESVTRGTPQATIGTIQVLQSVVVGHVSRELEKMPLKRESVVLEIDPLVLPATEDGKLSEGYLADFLGAAQAARNTPWGKGRMHLTLKQSPFTQQILSHPLAQDLFTAEDALPAAAARVALSSTFQKGALTVLMQKLEYTRERAPVPAWPAIFMLLVYTGSVDINDIHESYLLAWIALSGVLMDKVILRNILLGLDKLEKLLAYAIKPTVYETLNLVLRAFDLARRQLARAA